MASTVPSPTFNRLAFGQAITGERHGLHSVDLRSKSDIASRAAVLRALERVLESEVFRQSIRLSQFLRFTVAQTLQGLGGNLKEYTIATEVYGRKPDFDPGQDTIVRSEARRLRRKLKEYYESDGKDDDVVITFNPGSYIPVSRWRANLAKPSHLPARPLRNFWACEDEVQVVVKPFLSHAGDPQASALAFGVADEILYRLMRITGIRVVWRSVAEQNAEDSGFQIIVDGTVWTLKGRLRVTARVTTADGLILWSQRFDAGSEGETSITFSDLVAASIVTRISPSGAMARGYASADSYLFYSEALAAEALLEAGSISSINAALQRFEGLTAKAPGYARAHSGLAQCCVALSQCGFDRSAEINVKGKQACLAAFSADPCATTAHSAMGCLLAQEWKWKDAEDRFRTALRLSDYHIAHRQYSEFLLAQKQFDGAWKHLQVADETDPFSTWQKLSKARFLYYSRWQGEANQYYWWLEQQGPMPFEVRVLQALTEIQRGERTKTKALAEEIHKAGVAACPVYLAWAAELLALCDEKDVARSLVANARMLENAAPISCFRKASLALSLKDRTAGLKFLEESWRHREPELLWVGTDPRFDDLRGEPEFLAICKSVFHSEAAQAPERETVQESLTR
jgi:TolB-like protein/Tfp pilus assembly protein PilF